MTLPVSALNIVRTEYDHALAQVEAKFATMKAVGFDEVCTTCGSSKLYTKTCNLVVTPRMRAEDCLEETLTMLMHNEPLVPFIVHYRKGTTYSHEDHETNRKQHAERTKARYAKALNSVGVRQMATAFALATFLMNTRGVLIQHLRSLHYCNKHELKPDL